MNLTARLARLENRAVVLPQTMHLKDAAELKARIIAMSKHFDPADQYISGLERAVRFSPAQELAWVMRFGSDKEFEAALLATLQYAKEAMQ